MNSDLSYCYLCRSYHDDEELVCNWNRAKYYWRHIGRAWQAFMNFSDFVFRWYIKIFVTIAVSVILYMGLAAMMGWPVDPFTHWLSSW